eukprot:m51a1_g6021 hypothetical protein (183) ;mRNA; f:83980-84743
MAFRQSNAFYLRIAESVVVPLEVNVRDPASFTDVRMQELLVSLQSALRPHVSLSGAAARDRGPVDPCGVDASNRRFINAGTLWYHYHFKDTPRHGVMVPSATRAPRAPGAAPDGGAAYRGGDYDTLYVTGQTVVVEVGQGTIEGPEGAAAAQAAAYSKPPISISHYFAFASAPERLSPLCLS